MQESRFTSKFLMWLFLAVTIVWLLSGIIIYFFMDNWGDRGTMGDMFGAINALFSGLALAGLIFTILIQQEEIRLNRSEITQNRKELKKSANAQQRSQEALKEQAAQTHLTAKINAMSTIINYYNLQIANKDNPPELIEKARKKRRQVIQQIDDLIDGLQDSEVDDYA